MKPEEKDRFFLQHILQAIDKIEQLTEGISRKVFLVDWRTQDVVVRNLEIIGEAVSNISDDFKEAHSTHKLERCKKYAEFSYTCLFQRRLRDRLEYGQRRFTRF